MALCTSDYLKKLARERTTSLRKSLDSIILEEKLAKDARAKSVGAVFDIFLSHSNLDREEILGIVIELERFGYDVYVDWVIDTQPDRSKVTKEAAIKLRQRMDQCKALFFAIPANASSSIWMPWELGYVDGKSNGRAAILPVVKEPKSYYYGQEYLSVYPYVSKSPVAGTTREVLWVNESSDTYVSLADWLKGENPAKRS